MLKQNKLKGLINLVYNFKSNKSETYFIDDKLLNTLLYISKIFNQDFLLAYLLKNDKYQLKMIRNFKNISCEPIKIDSQLPPFDS